MKRWHIFLESLATRGGAIFVLIIANAALLAVVIYFAKHNELSGVIATLIGQTFGNFSGALLLGLRLGPAEKKNGAADATNSGGG